MKKMLSTYHAAYFPPIKLYRNDLDEIIALLSRVCKEIELSDKSHVFDSLDDIKTNMGLHIKQLTIRGKSPNITITIGAGFIGDDVCLTTSDAEGEIKLLFHELKDLLQRKLKWVSKINFSFLWFFVVGSFSIMPFISTIKSYAQNNIFLIPFLLLFLLITIIYFGLFFYKREVGSSIYLDYKHNLDFWYANRDKIIIGLIMAAVGILGTILTQYVIRKLF